MLVSIIGCAAVVAGLGLFASMNASNKKLKKKYEDEYKEWENNPRYYNEPKKPQYMPAKVSLSACLVGALLIGSQCLYTQDAGDVKVLIDFGGNIAGSSSDTGFHVKAPWQSIVTYDIRNNVISFVADGAEDYIGGSANGPQVTVNDSSGTKANIDIQVNYSLDPSKAIELYESYGTQENFVRAIAAVDARSIPREVSGQFDTITMLTNRGEFTNAVEEALKEKWEPLGLSIEQISIQEIRYPDTITDAYANAQQAEVEKQKALNSQETAKVEAETRAIEAAGEAEANRILNESLTDNVIQEHYVEALKQIGKEGNLVVVPEGSQPIVGSNKQ